MAFRKQGYTFPQERKRFNSYPVIISNAIGIQNTSFDTDQTNSERTEKGLSHLVDIEHICTSIQFCLRSHSIFNPLHNTVDMDSMLVTHFHTNIPHDIGIEAVIFNGIKQMFRINL